MPVLNTPAVSPVVIGVEKDIDIEKEIVKKEFQENYANRENREEIIEKEFQEKHANINFVLNFYFKLNILNNI